ncbi:MAG: MFS transporter [Betaproteobacteria bacterium]
MNTPTAANAVREFPPVVSLMLNIGHGIDHMFLLIFATAVATIATDFDSNWADLMPYSAGAFLMFGLGALPAGRLGDLWGRRNMMLIFFFGMGASALLVALTQNSWQLAAALLVMGAFASIYHPVGIPMLVQNVHNPGEVIGMNGLAGNLGIAVAAILTGFLIKWAGWRAAFVVPGLLAFACGVIFALQCPRETVTPAKRSGKAKVALSSRTLARVFFVMTATAATSSILFNFTTSGNAQLLAESFRGVIEDPALLGALLALIYAVASLAQLVVGKLIDRVAFKPLQLWLSVAQIPFLIIAAYAEAWGMFAALLGVMILVFGSIPFTDAMIVRYVDDRLRSRVAGMRLTVAFGISSLAVWALGPLVKGIGFSALLWGMAGIAALKAAIVLLLPDEKSV